MLVQTEAEGRAEAARRIVRCRETRATSLDLGGLLLTELPAEVLDLHWLEALDLGIDKVAAEAPDFFEKVYNQTYVSTTRRNY